MKEVTTHGVPSRSIGYREAAESLHYRIRGDAKTAVIETAPSFWPIDKSANWTYEPVEGTVTIDDLGEVTVSSPLLEDASARSLAADYRRALRDEGLVQLEQGKRYKVGWHYVCLDRIEANRLAEINKTQNEITVADATPVHAENSWVLWSDGYITTSIGLPAWARKIKALSKDAAQLVSLVWGADSGRPGCGYKTLLDVDRIENEEVIEVGPHAGVYHRATIDRLDCRMKDGSLKSLYRYTAGYPEGYACLIESSEEALVAELRKTYYAFSED